MIKVNFNQNLSDDYEEVENFKDLKEVKKDVKKDVKPMWKILLHWLIFGIFLYIACRGIIFFWCIVYNFFHK